MENHPLLIALLLSFAAALCLLCSVGVAVMRDGYQRLQYTAPITGISAPLIAAAAWIESNELQVRIKTLLIVVILWATNAIVTHAIARAIRIRRRGHWEVGRAA